MGRFATAEQEFAWAVGIFEGEGAAGVYGNGGHSHAVAQIRMALIDKDTVERFHQAVGVGKTQKVAYASMDKPMYQWKLSRQADLLDLTERMYPYLSERRQKQLDAVMQFCRERLAVPSRARGRWDGVIRREKEGVP